MAAAPPAPVILNAGAQNSGNAQWMETQAQPDDGNASVKQFVATFLVQHAVGRTVNAVKLDANFDGTDTTAAAPSFAVTAQTYVASAGGIETSRVTVNLPITKPGGFSCPFIASAVRSVDAPVRMRVVDSTGEQSASVATTVKFVEDAQCAARQDFPRMTAVSQSLTEVVPGQTITYTFSCDDVDPDLVSSDDDCDRANIRWRRLDDGTVSAVTLKTGINDSTSTSHSISFPSQGYYVVEAQLGNEDGSFPNTGGSTQGWWRLGNAVVNDSSSSLSGALSLTGVQLSAPASVNPGGVVTAIANATDTGGGIQVIEWDANGNGSFERREYTVPVNLAGDIVHPALTTAELSQAVDTTAPGVKTIVARITDNGALDAADNVRRQLTFSTQVRVNAVPTASDVSAASNDGSPVTITLAGNDSDNQPGALVYTIVSPPSASAGTLGALSGNRVVFAPAAGFSGSTSFTYRVADGPAANNGAFASSNIATVRIQVSAPNDVPMVDPKSATTAEDGSVNVQATGTDADGPLTWTVATQPTNGSATCHLTTGLCTYTPAPNFFGSDTFVVRGTDSEGASATATFSVTVTEVNDAPVAEDQLVTLAEDGTASITLTASDVDDVDLTFAAAVDDVDYGALSCEGGSCAYTPAPDYNGPDSFAFTVSDGPITDTGVVTLDVAPVNDAPVAIDVSGAETDEDVALPLTLGGTDVDGDAVTVSDVAEPDNGTATIVALNAVEYLGVPNFHGTDTFEFEVTDSQGGLDSGSVVVTVRPVNDAPAVDDQYFQGIEDTPLSISVAAGDVDGDDVRFSVVSGPTSGVLSGTAPDLTYTPALNFFGGDSFTIRVSDGNGGVAEATISIGILPVNDPPDAADLTVSTAEDTAKSFDLAATDPDGDALSYAIAPAANGVVTCIADACTYQPAPDFNGSELLVFRATDPGGASSSGTVTITVTPVNDAPVAADIAGTGSEDTPLAITLAASDADGDTLVFVAGSPVSGHLTGTPPDVVYHPPEDFSGSDSFTYSVSDGHGGTDQASVGVTVNEVNDVPVAADLAVETPANTAVTFELGAVDVDGDVLTYSALVEPTSGFLSCDLSLRECTYTPAVGVVGEFTFDYGVSDGRGGSDTGRVTITVRDVTPPTVVIRAPGDGSQVVLGSSLVADYECADEFGVASCVGDAADGSSIGTSAPGPATFTVEATDSAGNRASVVSRYTVVYVFEGFGAPVDGEGVANRATAGSRIPLRWRVSGADGGVSDAASVASVTSRQVACASETVADTIEEITTTPGGLIYKNDGNWQYTWVTSRSWANTCREVTLRLADGSVHTALFAFR